MSDVLDGMQKAALGFVDQARAELEARWKAWRIDLGKREYHEVVGALLARQVTLGRGLAESPMTWTGHHAPLFLRAMADVHIALAWVLGDHERAREFIKYGLGQEKLRVEHLRSEAGENSPPEQSAMLDATEEWINSQRFTFLTEVNVGSWSGKSTRKMAEEGGCLDFYNLVYQPFSACTHSMWHHVGRYNVTSCENPLHQFHRIPDDPDLSLDIHYLYLAGKYVEKSFRAFDETTGISVGMRSAFDQLADDIHRLGGEHSGTSGSTKTAEDGKSDAETGSTPEVGDAEDEANSGGVRDI